MKTVNKTNKTSINKKDIAKKKSLFSGDGPKWAEAYAHCFGLTYKPVTEAFINAFFEDLFKYVTSDEDVLQVESFYLKKGISVSTYYGWVKKWPQAKKINEICMNICGTRRELGAMKNELNAKFVSLSLYHYLPRYKECEEWRSSLKEKETEKLANALKIVEIPAFGSSDLVPKKKPTNKTPEEVAKKISKHVKDNTKNSLPS